MPNPKTTKSNIENQAEVEEFAIIESGGKQYRVAVGDTIAIEKINDLKVGDNLVFEKVLLVDDGKNTSIGEPYIKGAQVEGEVSEVGRAKKIEVMRYKAKSRYFKNKGHRQPYLAVKVTAIK